MQVVDRILALVVVLELGGAAVSNPVTAQASNGMSSEARAYLAAALDTIEAVTIGRDSLPWPLIRDSAFYYAYGARKPADTHGGAR